MHDLLPFIVIGLITGSVYGLAATGLVLSYKTSGIFNFAYGSLSALGVFVFYWLNTTHGIPWGYAAALVLLVLAPLEGVLLEYFARHVSRQSATLQVVATVGLMLIVIGIGDIWYGGEFDTFPQFLPEDTVEVGGVFISYAQIIVFAVAVVGVA